MGDADMRHGCPQCGDPYVWVPAHGVCDPCRVANARLPKPSQRDPYAEAWGEDETEEAA
jgi:predicted  nucleic acid-binding Zn-ribbon protein